MKKGFKAVYEISGKEIEIPVPSYLGLLLNFQNSMLDFEDFELSKEQEEVFDETYNLLEKEVSKIFTDFTGIKVADLVFKSLKKKEEKNCIRVQVTPQEVETIKEDDMVEIEESETSVTVTSEKRSTRVSKRLDGANVIHIRSFTENVGKGSAVKHYLSDGDEVKNTLLALTDDALKELTIALAIQSSK